MNLQSTMVLLVLLLAGPARAEPALTGLTSETLLESGPSAKKIDLVFCGDGYTKSERGAFKSAVEAALRELWKVSPFLELKTEFNVHLVYVDSPSGGWDQNGRRKAEFIFGSEKPAGETRDMVRLHYPERVEVAVHQAPDCDVPIVITRLQGRSHSGRPIVLQEKSATSFAHEMGHQLAGLGDEYTSSTFTVDREKRRLPSGKDLKYANLTTSDYIDPSTPQTLRKTAKWRHFFDLPDGDVVSAYQGGYYRVVDVWRPSYQCVMSNSRQLRFCPVCHEEVYKHILLRNGKSFDHDAYHRAFPLKNWRSKGIY